MNQNEIHQWINVQEIFEIGGKGVKLTELKNSREYS